MERLIYLLDSNAVSDFLNHQPVLKLRVENAIARDHLVCLAQPVHYEVSRGLLKVGATRKLTAFEDEFVPQLDWLALADRDWREAAKLWADATRKGKQLSDVDFLLAALAIRFNAILVSSDNDFDVLPVRRENWRV